MLRLEQIEVVYHRVVTAVQGVTISVGAGQFVALLGTNGAGKTTTLRAISGFLGLDDARVTEGRILFDGRAIENQAPHRITEQGICLVPERDKVFENLTVGENLEAAVTARRARRAELRDVVYGQFPRLAELRRREAGYLSGGERQMLAIGSALMCDPRLLMIDELSQGLAPVIVEDLLERLRHLREKLGLTVLLVEQNAQVALEAADYGYVIESGRIVLDGTPARLLEHGDVQEFYLGGTGGERRSYRDVKQYRRSRRWYG
ncbi:MAG: ABC transporter ATP-binding protein [Burkholderiaceae bacterium]|nr:ABC transporter ATP-binding protein [Burkholderiaceae bacterium]